MLEIKSNGETMEIELNGSGKEILSALSSAVISITNILDRKGGQTRGTAMSILSKAILYYALNETEEENAKTERVSLS